VDKPESCLPVQVPCGQCHIICLKDDLLITSVPGEQNQFIDQAFAYSKPKSLSLTSNKRSWATVSDFFTKKTQPTCSPAKSAIQQCSRFFFKLWTQFATMCSTIAGKFLIEPELAQGNLPVSL